MVFLDYYLTIPPPAKFSSPLPFTLAGYADILEGAIDDVVPDRFYSKIELLDYVLASQEKCYRLIMSLAEEQMNERFIEEPGTGSMDYSTFEILLYNMRHVQQHVGQLNMLLRKHINHTSGWVARAGEE